LTNWKSSWGLITGGMFIRYRLGGVCGLMMMLGKYWLEMRGILRM